MTSCCDISYEEYAKLRAELETLKEEKARKGYRHSASGEVSWCKDEEMEELEDYRSLANTYTPNGTVDELQTCLEECEELTEPDGWNWDVEAVFTLASDTYGLDDFITESTTYQDMVEEKDEEIEILLSQVKECDLIIKQNGLGEIIKNNA